MPIDANKVQWDAAPAAPAIDINAVQWDTSAPQSGVPGPRKPSGLESFASSALSVPAGVPAAAFGLLEVPTTMLTGALGHAVGIPAGVASTFGTGFGTPEAARLAEERGARIARAMTYQPQTTVGRTLLGGISKSFEGLPPMIGGNVGQSTAALAAPAMAQAAPIIARTAAATKKLLGPSEAKIAQMTAEDYARGPQIDAAAQAQRLGIAIPPTSIQNTTGVRVASALAGEKGKQTAAQNNVAQVRKIQLNEMGLPETAMLNGPEAFDLAKEQVAGRAASAGKPAISGPYQEIGQLPIQTADDSVRARLESLRPSEKLINSDNSAAQINAIIDDALSKTGQGLTGKDLLDNVSMLRKRARRTYDSNASDAAALEVADTNLAVANALESMIDANVGNPKLLTKFREARQKMARIYAYEGATDFNTGLLDVKKLARITGKDNALTGDIAALGQIAGNFPDSFVTKPVSGWGKAAAIGRTGLAGGLGGLAGYEMGGYPGAIIGGLGGSLAGHAGQNALARRMASPEFQATLRLRDLRTPANQLTPAEINYGSNQLVPYQPEVLGPSDTTNALNLRIVGYDANGRPIYKPEEARGGFTMPGQPEFGVRPTVVATERAITNEIPRQTYEAQKRAELAQGFREAAERQPTKGEVILDINPLTGAPEISKGLKGATPETFQNFGSSLASAADKVTAGKSFDLTAAERVAWNKTKVDLAEIMPGMKALDEKAVAAKMMDRDWAAQAVEKARQQAVAFEQIAARAKDAQARAKAIAERERMLDLAEQMEEGLRTSRPVSTGGQGPKTRAFQRNRLNPDQEVLNQLLGK